MTIIPIKALSVNRAFQGRRFRTKEYDQYERDLLLLLPKTTKKYGKKLRLDIEFGISSLQDLDGCLKQTIDILAKKYGFNDRYIHEIHAGKVIVKRGSEFIAFEITEI